MKTTDETLTNLDALQKQAKEAMRNAPTLREKIRFQRLRNKLRETRRRLLLSYFDLKDMVAFHKTLTGREKTL